MVQVLATKISKFDMLQMVPNSLIWIQVWCIPGQTFQPNPLGGACGQERLDGLTPVNGCTIPDDEQLAFNQDQQLLQKGNDCRAVESLGLHAQIEFTRWGDSTDDRVVIPGELTAQNRCLAHGRPGTHHTWQQIEGGFINEQKRAFFGYGSFFSSGHVTATHCSIAASSRWLARTSGRCALQPSCRSKGPIESR